MHPNMHIFAGFLTRLNLCCGAVLPAVSSKTVLPARTPCQQLIYHALSLEPSKTVLPARTPCQQLIYHSVIA